MTDFPIYSFTMYTSTSETPTLSFSGGASLYRSLQEYPPPPPRTSFTDQLTFRSIDYQISLPIRLQKLETLKYYISGVLIASTFSFLSLSYHGCAQWDTRTELPLLREKVLQNYAKFIWFVKAPPGYTVRSWPAWLLLCLRTCMGEWQANAVVCTFLFRIYTE